MLNLWNCERLSFESLFLVRLAISIVVTILAGVFSCFFMFLIVWFCFSAFGWVLIPISFATFVYYVMGKIRNQI